MKRVITSLTVLAAVLSMSFPINANSQLTLFDDGGEYSNNIPINMVYLDESGTQSQVIYPASALSEMTDEVINAITFYIAGEGITVSGGSVRISLTETDLTGFPGGYITEGLTTVATVSMTPGVTELVITFDEPYMYHGRNLVIDTYIEESTEFSYDLFEGMRPDNYNAMTHGEVTKFLPKTTFDYGTNDMFAAKVVPGEVTFNTIRAEREDVQSVMLKNVGQSGFTPSFSVNEPFFVDIEANELAAGESLEVPIRFAPMQPGNHSGVLSIDCGQAGTLQVALQGVAMEAAVDYMVGDSTDYASFVPIYGADIDIVGTQGQVIYPASMLADMAGTDILALKFHLYKEVQMNGGVIQLSLKTVDKTVFTSATLETGTTVVATMVPVYHGKEFEFVFDEPYHYDGGNLLVDCLVTVPGITNNRQTFFYGTPTEDLNVGIAKTYYYGGVFDTDLVPFLPAATFSYKKQGSPEILRGDVNKDGTISILDVTTLISYLLNGTEAPDEADCDLSGRISIGDVTTLIRYLLSGEWL